MPHLLGFILAKLKVHTYSFIEGDSPEQLMEKYMELQTSTGKSYTLEFVYDTKRKKHVAYYYATIEVEVENFKDNKTKETKLEIGVRN